jgi:hypothetical protein
MLACPSLARQQPLGDPFALGGAGLYVQPHVVDGRDVCEQPDARLPHREAGTGRTESCARGAHPCRFPYQQPASRDEPGIT